MLKRIIILYVLLIGFLFSVYGQNEQINPEIKVIGKVTSRENHLRWAPNNSLSWDLLKEYGYKIERITTYRNGKLLANPEKVWLTERILPKPEEEWGRAFDADTSDMYIAVAAQALFGTSFNITSSSTNNSPLASIVHQVKEREARFSYALFGADQSKKVAELSGVSWVDKNITKGERYLYRIYSLVPDSIEVIKTGKVLLNTEDVKPLPEPWNVNAFYRDGQVHVVWNWFMLSDVYNSYWIQRSNDNGANYTDLTDVPFVQPSKDTPSPNMLFVDTLGSLTGDFLYRIKGKDSFGDWGPYSSPFKINVKNNMNFSPNIDVGEDEASGNVKISWEVKENEKIGVQSLLLVRGENDKVFKDTLSKSLPVKTGYFLDIGPGPSNYYKLGALGETGKINWSLVSFYQTIDSIPPEPPIGLIADIDSLGRVDLNWDENIENDLLGYRVYRSNEKNGQYAQVTKKEIKHTSFQDSISIKVLNKKVYYKVLAVDLRGNPSGFSEPLEVTRPDIIPPAAPLIGKTSNTSKGPSFEWYPSASNDVMYHLIYRKGASETENWELIKEYQNPLGKQTFTDSSIVTNQVHYYLMIAVDESGLESIPTKPVGLHLYDNKVRAGVESLKISRIDNGINLDWVSPISEDYYIDIYKSIDDEPIRFYKRIEGLSNKYTDVEVNDGKLYTYRLKVKYKEGGSSNYSSKVQIKF
ncbi:hypothetical protein MY04_3358 [Flammeovirga sp. MY04]|uniref:fibronectin type III domain-containing protein n=1 Tax=Flammeovirga sp. MY04 TaxID=1191459 RepID=UPI0008063D65|nr:hypothetical protein [Flammeovirga sp. MY04]ANQ50720.1 hypothetical protein MY04_3358 [Flammeovirga sp. MY04]